MEEGRIIERGTHEDLMRARGEYYGMVVRQMESHGEYAGGALQEEVLR
jgi:ABC-type transport system involved in cytochrome bd biosynthesis fused ATPase/permease subunit